MSLAVVCFLWRDGGRDYRVRHVDVLASMVRRHLQIPHDFVCISDETGFGPGVTAMALPPEARHLAAIQTPEGNAFPSSYRRLWLFSEAAKILGERVLLLDVDCVITGDLAPLLELQADFVGWQPNYAWGTNRRLGGGTWLLRTGTKTDVWAEFGPQGIQRARAAGFRGSDQAWISYKLVGRTPVWPPTAGIYQAQDMRRSGYRQLPPDARIVHFNGAQKPWHLAPRIRWIGTHYR